MALDEGGAALKLRAEDGDDLAVLSACLQDAIVPVRDLAYIRDQQTFVFIANRFRWESGQGPAPGDVRRQRILCAVTFEAVDGASYRGFSRRDEERMLVLLAIRAEPAPGGAAAIHLEFSGHAAIRLDVAYIQCRAKDLGEPWPTPWHPRHDPEGP